MDSNGDFGLYVHIPFCRKACVYCDFHFSTQLERSSDLVGALRIEWKNRAALFQGKTLKTIYFGGGTPSVLEPVLLEPFIEDLYNTGVLNSVEEWTLEANPDDLDQDRLKAWKQWGVNRLSLGIQSFDDVVLHWMNRAHNAAQSAQALERIQRAGFEHFSIDLIYGLPHTLPDVWEADLRRALSWKPEHISAYALTVEAKTALDHAVRKSLTPHPTENRVVRDYERLCDAMAEAGYEHYEVSNFALPGHRALHNSAYWENRDYLGLGPSAHARLGDRRWANLANNARYIRAIHHAEDCSEEEVLGSKETYNERVMTGLRTAKGIDERWLSGLDPSDRIRAQRAWKTAVDRGQLIGVEGVSGVYRVPENQWLTTDALCRDLFA